MVNMTGSKSEQNITFSQSKTKVFIIVSIVATSMFVIGLFSQFVYFFNSLINSILLFFTMSHYDNMMNV